LELLGLVEQDGASELLANDSGKMKLLARAEVAHDELFDTKRFW
jgi:hypothetical protein